MVQLWIDGYYFLSAQYLKLSVYLRHVAAASYRQMA